VDRSYFMSLSKQESPAKNACCIGYDLLVCIRVVTYNRIHQ
jgi:hypothetical protein